MCSSKIIKKSLSKPSPLPVQLYRSILILSRTHTGILILLSSSWIISFNHSLSLSPTLFFHRRGPARGASEGRRHRGAQRRGGAPWYKGWRRRWHGGTGLMRGATPAAGGWRRHRRRAPLEARSRVASFAHRPMSLPPSLPSTSRSLGSLVPSPAFRPLTPSPLDHRDINTVAAAAS